MVTQQYHLPVLSDNPVILVYPRDPWTYHPWEYDPWNARETLIEAMVIWVGLLYGLFRLINIWRIVGEDDQERLWSDFWALCETL